MKRFTFAVLALFFSVTSAFALEGALMFKALSGGNPVDQVISNAASPYQTLTFNSAAYDTGGFWNSTRNCFEIPAGVAKIRLTGQAIFLYNTSGIRQLLVQRSAPGQTTFTFFPGQPILNTRAVTGTTTDIFVSSPALPVTEGECYALQPYQDSGSSVSISGGGGTFFGLEVVE